MARAVTVNDSGAVSGSAIVERNGGHRRPDGDGHVGEARDACGWFTGGFWITTVALLAGSRVTGRWAATSG